MAKKVPRYYWDACTFLSTISADPNHPDRMPAVEHLLAEAEAGNVRIFTSVVSIAEVVFAAEEKANKALDPAAQADIDELWRPGSPITLVDYSRTIGLNARSLSRAGLPHGRVLKPYDAVHLASAQYAQVDELHSYDGPLARYQKAVTNLPFGITSPPPPPDKQMILEPIPSV